MIRLKEKYFYWLCSLVGLERNQRAKQPFLHLQFLHEKEFYHIIRDDANRELDGQALRVRFGDEYDVTDAVQKLAGPCSMLEMMVGLALRMEELMDGTVDDASPERWFWEMMTNLEIADDDFERTVENCIDRNYDMDGYGSLFPIHRPEQDMREVPVWMQMNAYLIENYSEFVAGKLL